MDSLLDVPPIHVSPLQQEQGRKGYRACFECRRKKTRCDMIHPVCSLCRRVGVACTFPTRRKSPEFKTGNPKKSLQLTRQNMEWLIKSFAPETIGDGDGDGGGDGGGGGDGVDDDDFDCVINDTGAARLEEHQLRGQPRDFVQDIQLLRDDVEQAWSLPPLNGETAVGDVDSFGGSAGEIVAVAGELEGGSAGVSLEVAPELAVELVNLFFARIHPWLPMLHKPRFYRKYGYDDNIRLSGHSIEEAMLLNGVFALAARYSSSAVFESLAACEQGELFFKRAWSLYNQARDEVDQSNNRLYLQGCILLAFYAYANGPCPRGWILTGVCVRVAYEMSLNTLDEDDDEGLPSNVDWASKEELRRAWWLVWELDAFGSIISQRPYAIDRRRVFVKLPVSDEAFFANKPISSNVLPTRPALVWKILRDCENQSERAWFLVVNYLLMLSWDLAHGTNDNEGSRVQDIFNALTCFELLLPRELRLENVVFRPSTSTSATLIICIHLMLMSAKNAVSVYRAKKTLSVASPNTIASALDISSTYHRLPEIIARWSPDYIHLCHPFIACMLVPLHFGPSWPGFNIDSADGFLDDMASLAIARFAEHWQLGKILLQICELIKRGSEHLSPYELQLAKRFAVYFPRRPSKARISPRTVVGSTQSSTAFAAPMMTASSDAQRTIFDVEFNQSTGAVNAPVPQSMELRSGLDDMWLPTENYFCDHESNLDFFAFAPASRQQQI